MVMEAPTPQCVGLEFVRQYYTILNKAPCHLHRFYATNSSFMHGGENSNRDPIIGQTAIHKYIQDLNFKDCHAKILLIDSQATMADGVVIQVTGELSNDGRPMRRFMQTFVLAPQSEKKYYVHNDIFRYQDQVFHEDCETSGEECPEEPSENNGHVEDMQQQQQAAPQEVVAATGVSGATPDSVGAAVVAPPPGVSQQVVDYPVQQPLHQSAAVVHPVSAPQPQVMVQHSVPQQQQQLNGNITSPQELAAAVVSPAAVVQQSPVVAQTPSHQHHHLPPQAPAQQSSPPQANVAPHQTSSHVTRQVESSISSSSTTAAAAAAQAPAVRESQDKWGSSAGDEWGSSTAGNWEETPSQAPAPQQAPAPRHQQQVAPSSRATAASPPSQAPASIPEKKSAPQQPQPVQSYAAWLKQPAPPTPATSAPLTPPQREAPPAHHYQGREPNSRVSQQQQQQSTTSTVQQQSASQQRDQPAAQQHNNRDREQRDRDRDQGNSGGFQRAGRGGRPVNYRSRNNYSESGAEHNNGEDNSSSVDGSGYGGSRVDDRRRGPAPMSVPDTHQIFVGNLPQTMQEDELRSVFCQFGSIVEVRINIGKGKPGGPSNVGKLAGSVPNFGFVTFEDDGAVGRCLKARPITINGDHRLNVEEKKTKSKISGEGGGYTGRPNMRSSMHQGGGGGGRGGGGGGFGRVEGGRGPGGPRGGGGGGGGGGGYGAPHRR